MATRLDRPFNQTMFESRFNSIMQPINNNGKKKVILITGCDSGFGFSLACHMSEKHGQDFLTIACSYFPSEGSKILKEKPNLIVLPLGVHKSSQFIFT